MLGAGKRDRVLKSYLISLLYSFGIGGAMGLLLVIFGKQFLSLFTADPEVITAGLKRLTIMGFSYGVSAFMDCTIAASRALGKSLVPMFIVIMGSYSVLYGSTLYLPTLRRSRLCICFMFSPGPLQPLQRSFTSCMYTEGYSPRRTLWPDLITSDSLQNIVFIPKIFKYCLLPVLLDAGGISLL